MLCRVEMPSNEQIFGRFYRYRLLRGSAGKGRGNTALYVVLLVMIVAMVLLFDLSLLVLPVVAAVAAAYVGYTFYMKPNRLFSAKPGAALNTEVTIFTDNGLTRTVRSEEGGLPDNLSMSYSGLHSAVETKQDFYLFTSPTQAFLVDKAYFTNGEPAQLRQILQSKLGERFKTKQQG